MLADAAYACRHCRKPFPVSELCLREDSWRSVEGAPFPLGMSWIPQEQSYNFALFSKHAAAVDVLFFDEGDFDAPSFCLQLDPLRNKSGRIWHCRVSVEEVREAAYYGYRVSGPTQQSADELHSFDCEKLLLDPYAKSVFFPPEFDRSTAQRPGSNMGRAPLALLDECQCPFAWNTEQRVRHESDLIIYELHVRGFTQNPNSDVRNEHRGTFQGVIEKIPYLLDLGITAIELMPVFQFDPQEGNYWGYMPLSFFAPHHGYSKDPDSCAQRTEFRRMVQALHHAGIEVILDVVFNHTCEGDERGPTYHLKGIDNSTYYMVMPGRQPTYANFSGCGNTLHTANPAVRRLIIDSLKYWVSEMHVDGFRFDLASVFTRNSDGSLNLEDPPIFGEIAADPELVDVRLIAEPWDAGDGFLLGERFPGALWMQWNSRYRETLQRFVRGDTGLVGDLMTRLYGSSDLFPDDVTHACRPFQSVNYVVAHDGFTLYDLVSYDRRHNEVNGHQNTDGANDFSWNCGVEGDVDVPDEVMQLRKRQVKNLFCLLMLSNGTPMFRMGDEFLQTQYGNNNPYREDSETTWLNWSRLDRHAEIHRFVKSMIAVRKAHPALSRSQFWREDVRWFGPDGPVDLSSRRLAFALAGGREGDSDLYVMVNGDEESCHFTIQTQATSCWRVLVNTGTSPPHDICDQPDGDPLEGGGLQLGPRSVAVLTTT